MILTDYLRAEKDATWDVAAACGVRHAVIRLPEDGSFDYTSAAHWKSLCARYESAGFTPLVLEPLPNALHDHIKTGDALRDQSIDTFLMMLPLMQECGITTVCFNFMAYLGWYRTGDQFPERGGATVTGFRLADFHAPAAKITEEQLWEHYAYFIRAVIPYAERYGIRLALHPDDPPMRKMGELSRIMVSYQNIRHAVRDIVQSDCLGVTMCQANYYEMGEDLFDIIPKLADKIFFIHFRNVKGTLHEFYETFHDNGELPMARLMRLYQELGIQVPIRVDHVPTLPGDSGGISGYQALGRYFAIGYLKGLMEATELT